MINQTNMTDKTLFNDIKLFYKPIYLNIVSQTAFKEDLAYKIKPYNDLFLSSAEYLPMIMSKQESELFLE